MARKRYKSMAGAFSISDKNPSEMTNAQLHKEHEHLTLHDSAIGREFINTGRGMEKPSEIRNKTDDLATRYNVLSDRIRALHAEAESRNKMGGRRVEGGPFGARFIGGMPGSLKRGYYEEPKEEEKIDIGRAHGGRAKRRADRRR